MSHVSLALESQVPATPVAGDLSPSRARFKFLLLQSLITVALSYQVLFSGAGFPVSELQESLVLALLLMTGSVMVLPAWVLEASWFPASLVFADTVAVTSIIYASGNARTDLYVVYFLIILIAASVPNLKHVIGLSLLLSLGYGVVLFTDLVETNSLSAGSLLGIPVLLVMATFHGLTAQMVQRERRQKAALQNRLEALRLAETTLQDNQDHLQQQIAHLTKEQADLKAQLARSRSEANSLFEQLQETPRMEVVSRMARGLVPIFDRMAETSMMVTRSLLMDPSSKSPAQAHAEPLSKVGHQARIAARQLQTIGMLRTPVPKPFSVNTLLAEMERTLRAVFGPKIELRLFLDPTLGMVKADPDHLEEAILSLTRLAKDALPTGGAITIESGHVDLTQEFARRHPGARVGRHIKIAVRHDGRGLSPDLHDRVFEPFALTARDGQEIGLHLSAVYALVKHNGGYIDAVRQPQQGSAIEIYLPRLQEAASPCPLRETGAGGLSETVLVVEPDQDPRAFMVETLKQYGYVVLEATTPGDGLKLLKQYTGTVHMLLVNGNLVETEGPRLAALARGARPSIKLVEVSAGHNDLNAATGSTPWSRLQGPLTTRSLARNVRAMLDRR